MNTKTNSVLAAAAMTLTLLASAGLQAQASSPAAAAAKAASTELIEAEVRKVDKDARKITLKHGEIKSLDMPPMTMVFGVRDPAMLNELKAGDKVRFKATDEGGGRLTVTEIQAAR